MRQYEEKYVEFSFLGVYPIDFAEQNTKGTCTISDMCNFKVTDFINSGKKQFGIVFNTDKSTGPGQHWIALFCSLDPHSPKYGICFFDSIANKPPKEVLRFMLKVRNDVRDSVFFNKIETSFRGRYNVLQKQFKNYVCGLMSITFLIMCLRFQNETYKETCSRIGKDEEVNQSRDVLYSPNFQINKPR